MVRVCGRWTSFMPCKAIMQLKTKEQTLGRRDGNSHCHPVNVAWRTVSATVNDCQFHQTADAKLVAHLHTRHIHVVEL